MSIETFKDGVANDLRNELVRIAPVDTSRLRNSIKVDVVGEELVISMVFYGMFIEHGIRPHIIRPKNKKALKFKVKSVGSTGKESSEVVITKEVHHPGTKAFPFIRNTFYHKLPNIVSKNATIHLGSPDAAEVVF
uniref:Putative tail protein n=1 Tax=viral metagenome TaxID=1070528 RepID=A0A6M3LFD3_9ZZZZ